MLVGSLATARILTSEEGGHLRSWHEGEAIVHYLPSAMFNTEVAVKLEATSYHIVPGLAALCSALSEVLLQSYGHYAQSINFPTMLQGQEKLRIAPTATPHATPRR